MRSTFATIQQAPGIARGLTTRTMRLAERSSSAQWLLIFVPVLTLYLMSLRNRCVDDER